MYHPETQTDAKVTLSEACGTSDWTVPLPKGSLVLAVRRPRVLHASPVSPALKQTLTLWRFEELLFLMDFFTERHTSYQPVGRLGSPSPPSCSPVLTVPLFVCFSPQGSHLVVKMDPLVVVFYFQRYNNECTPTDWNKTRFLYQLTVV